MKNVLTVRGACGLVLLLVGAALLVLDLRAFVLNLLAERGGPSILSVIISGAVATVGYRVIWPTSLPVRRLIGLLALATGIYWLIRQSAFFFYAWAIGFFLGWFYLGLLLLYCALIIGAGFWLYRRKPQGVSLK
jgi:hypothetical protein